jgi:hypothetical protein
VVGYAFELTPASESTCQAKIVLTLLTLLTLVMLRREVDLLDTKFFFLVVHGEDVSLLAKSS